MPSREDFEKFYLERLYLEVPEVKDEAWFTEKLLTDFFGRNVAIPRRAREHKGAFRTLLMQGGKRPKWVENDRRMVEIFEAVSKEFRRKNTIPLIRNLQSNPQLKSSSDFSRSKEPQKSNFTAQKRDSPQPESNPPPLPPMYEPKSISKKEENPIKKKSNDLELTDDEDEIFMEEVANSASSVFMIDASNEKGSELKKPACKDFLLFYLERLFNDGIPTKVSAEIKYNKNLYDRFSIINEDYLKKRPAMFDARRRFKKILLTGPMPAWLSAEGKKYVEMYYKVSCELRSKVLLMKVKQEPEDEAMEEDEINLKAEKRLKEELEKAEKLIADLNCEVVEQDRRLELLESQNVALQMKIDFFLSKQMDLQRTVDDTRGLLGQEMVIKQELEEARRKIFSLKQTDNSTEVKELYAALLKEKDARIETITALVASKDEIISSLKKPKEILPPAENEKESIYAEFLEKTPISSAEVPLVFATPKPRFRQPRPVSYQVEGSMPKIKALSSSTRAGTPFVRPGGQSSMCQPIRQGMPFGREGIQAMKLPTSPLVRGGTAKEGAAVAQEFQTIEEIENISSIIVID